MLPRGCLTTCGRPASQIMAFILMSSATLAVETPDSDGDSTLYALEVMFTIIFTIEVVVKVAAFGFVQHTNAYLRSAYNVVDFFVVVSSLLNLLITGVDLGALRWVARCKG